MRHCRVQQIISLFFAALLVIAALPAQAASGKVIKIGVAGAHSGDVASYGVPSLNAAKVVVADYNAKGGILGSLLEVVAQDDQCKPELATNAATKLVSDKVNVVMGHICSGATKAALPIYTNAKLVAVSPSATVPSLTLSGENPYFFRTISNDNDQARLAAQFIITGLKATKIAIIHDNTEYGRGYAETAKTMLEASTEGKPEIVLFEAINPDAVDFSAIIRKVRREKAEALVFGGYHPTASKIVQQLRREKMKTALIGPDGLKDEAFIKMAAADAEGVYASGPRDTSKLERAIKAREQHRAMFGSDPGAFYDNAYSATQALNNAMEKAGTATDSGKIMQALHTEYVETPLGRIKFGPKGDASGIGLSMFQVQNGKFVELDHYILLD